MNAWSLRVFGLKRNYLNKLAIKKKIAYYKNQLNTKYIGRSRSLTILVIIAGYIWEKRWSTTTSLLKTNLKTNSTTIRKKTIGNTNIITLQRKKEY